MSEIDPRLSTLARAKLAVAGGDISKAAVLIDRDLAAKTDLRLALIRWLLAALAEPARATPTPMPAAAQPLPGVTAQSKAPHSRRKTGVHQKQSGMPSAAQKAGALAAMAEAASGVFDRKMRGGQRLKQIKVRELMAIVSDSGHAAGSFILRGYEDAVDAILCRKLAHHCVTSDPDLTVEDIVKEEVAAKYFREAKIKASQFTQRMAAKIASELGKSVAPSDGATA